MPQPSQEITKRSVLIAVILIAVNSYIISYVEMIWHTVHLTTVSLPINAISSLLLLTWLNYILKKIWPGAVLSQRELMVIYVMLTVGSAFSGHDCMPRLMGLITYPRRYATPENDWEALFFRYLPAWLVITNPKTVMGFYEGETNFFTGGYLDDWLAPILAWSFAIFLLLLIFLFITVILRKEWVERERLSYPIIQVPLEITRESGRSIFKSRLLWIGFAIAAGIDIINGLNYFYPALPQIPVKTHNLSQYITGKPWNAMGSTPLRFYPFLTGLSFLLPLDISFSCVFFYLFGKAQRVVGSVAGIHYTPGFPFFGEQGTGALLALLAFALWGTRRHLARVAASLFRPSRTGDDSNEALSYRNAMLGLILCVLLFIGFCMKAGMSAWICVVFLGIYLAIVLGLIRIRAVMGPPIHAIGYVTPQYIMVSLLGTRRVARGNLTLLSLLNWLSGASYASFRTHPAPSQMEAFKIADRIRMSNRKMLIVIVIGCLAGIGSSLWLYPYVIHKEGVEAGDAEQILAGGSEAYSFLSNWLSNPQPPNLIGGAVMGVAFVFNMVIVFLRTRFLWFPLHPAGYVIGVAPGTIDKYWFTLLLCVVIKVLLLKYGGIKAYRKAVPFFIGIFFWALVSMAFHISVYDWL